MALMTGSRGEFLKSLLSVQPYKPGQGRIARFATLTVIGLFIGGGIYAWFVTSRVADPWVYKLGLPVAIGCVLFWVAFRMIQYPRFAEFLITTEAEMKKVSWPAKGEIRISTIVVLITVVLMAGFMFVVDMFWRMLLSTLGILKIGSWVSPVGFIPMPEIWLIDWLVGWLF